MFKFTSANFMWRNISLSTVLAYSIFFSLQTELQPFAIAPSKVWPLKKVVSKEVMGTPSTEPYHPEMLSSAETTMPLSTCLTVHLVSDNILQLSPHIY